MERYLKCVRAIAEEELDWKKLGPLVAQYRKLIEKEVEADTRKLYSLDAFKSATDDKAPAKAPQGQRGEISLRTFVEKRREYLLGHDEVKEVEKVVTMRSRKERE